MEKLWEPAAERQEASRRAGSYSTFPASLPPEPPILSPSKTSRLGSGLPRNPPGLREPSPPSQGDTESPNVRPGSNRLVSPTAISDRIVPIKKLKSQKIKIK